MDWEAGKPGWLWWQVTSYSCDYHRVRAGQLTYLRSGEGQKRSNQMLSEYKSEENTPGIISQLQTTDKETIRNQDVQDAH